MKETVGLINAKRPQDPTPPASPKDFRWPNQRDPDAGDVSEKLAAALQELLVERGMTHKELAIALWGTNEHGYARNSGSARRWVAAELPIPNEVVAGHLAQLLKVPMSRLLEPKGKFDPHHPMILRRSPTGTNLVKMGIRDKAERAKIRAKLLDEAPAKRKYVRTANGAKVVHTKLKTNGHGNVEGNGVWVLEKGIPAPEFQLNSYDESPGYLKLTIEAVVPHPRAMAILHMLEHQAPEE